jgi:hypothetical protein
MKLEGWAIVQGKKAHDAPESPSGSHSASFKPAEGQSIRLPEKCRKSLDYEALYNELHEAIVLIDTQTDAVLGDGEDKIAPEDAIKAIDSITSRVLWGKQDGEMTDENSYQNKNYTDRGIAAGISVGKDKEATGELE